MKKIINTFKYGDKKVKKSLALAILAGVVTLFFGVLALALSNMLCFFVAIVAAFLTITLVQTFMIAEGENPTVVKAVTDIGTDESVHMELGNRRSSDKKIKSKKPVGSKDKNKAQADSKNKGDAIIHNASGKTNKSDNINDSTVNETKLHNETQDTNTYITDNWNQDVENEEVITNKKKIKKERVKKEKNKKEKNKKEKAPKEKNNKNQGHSQSESIEASGEVDMATLLMQQNSENIDTYTEETNSKIAGQHAQPVGTESNNLNIVDGDSKEEDEENAKRKFKVITANTAASYTKKKIKKTLHKYKVMKDHRMVIVDRCDKLHIYQTPAYVWVQDNQFHILLIEEEPRLLMVPLFRITEISYLKKQPVDEEKDYKLFKNSTILTECFRPYLPDYNHSNKTTDLKSYKNLYGITQGIYFTNNSAKNLFDLLGVEFYVEDKVTTSNKVNIFFKDAYKANIKLRDNILDANGYADSITKILDDMAHSSISYNEFKDTLNLMIRNKLITDEYANHYMDVRNSL